MRKRHEEKFYTKPLTAEQFNNLNRDEKISYCKGYLKMRRLLSAVPAKWLISEIESKERCDD